MDGGSILERTPMTLRTLMQAGTAKATDLFTRLADTSDGAVKTRERLFTELTAELETHTDLEEQYLFPVLRKHAETKELVAGAIRDNKELRTALAELGQLPKNDESFLARLAELRKMFRQHARDETKALLPAVQRALSDEQVQGITEKMETSLAETEQAKHDQVEERRSIARRERAQAELQGQQEEAAEHELQAGAQRANEAALQTIEETARMAEMSGESARQISRSLTESAQRVVTSAASLTTGFPLWDMWLGMSGLRSIRSGNADTWSTTPAGTDASDNAQVISLAEEILTVGTRKVNSGTTRVRRYVVETPIEKQVTLVHERVVVERRRPRIDKVSGEMLTELTVEVVETDEVPVMGKTVRVKEEVVVRRERIEHVETVRDTVRHGEVEIEQSTARQPAHRLRLHERA
jgi:iron-sulfur cluster repair protein YtfE (RIC family)